MMKRIFESPMIEVICVCAEDVISTSGFSGKDQDLIPNHSFSED